MKSILVLLTFILFTSTYPNNSTEIESYRMHYYMVRIEQKAQTGELDINQIKDFINDRER